LNIDREYDYLEIVKRKYH